MSQSFRVGHSINFHFHQWLAQLQHWQFHNASPAYLWVGSLSRVLNLWYYWIRGTIESVVIFSSSNSVLFLRSAVVCVYVWLFLVFHLDRHVFVAASVFIFSSHNVASKSTLRWRWPFWFSCFWLLSLALVRDVNHLIVDADTTWIRESMTISGSGSYKQFMYGYIQL